MICQKILFNGRPVFCNYGRQLQGNNHSFKARALCFKLLKIWASEVHLKVFENIKNLENETFYCCTYMNFQQRSDFLIFLGPFQIVLNDFWCKGYQMKAKDLVFKLKSKCFKKSHCQCFKENGGKKKFTTYLCSEVDV